MLMAATALAKGQGVQGEGRSNVIPYAGRAYINTSIFSYDGICMSVCILTCILQIYSDKKEKYKKSPTWRRELYVLVVQICIANWLGFQFQFPGRCQSLLPQCACMCVSIAVCVSVCESRLRCVIACSYFYLRLRHGDCSVQFLDLMISFLLLPLLLHLDFLLHHHHHLCFFSWRRIQI